MWLRDLPWAPHPAPPVTPSPAYRNLLMNLFALGLLAGQCSVPDDFDAMAADAIADLFEGRAAAVEGQAGR